MLKILIFMLTGFSLSAVAQDLRLKCTAHHNLDLVVDKEVNLAPGAKNKIFGSFEDFRFYVSDKGSQDIEVHAFNGNEPSRTYATARLKDDGDFVEASVWNRELILDIRCAR